MRRALFRCDASLQIGSGHVMRCLTLADDLSARGWECAFACNDEAGDIVPALAAKAYRRVKSDGGGESFDLLVVDHYGLDASYERTCRAWAKRIVVLDDLADRPHECDVLADQTFGRDARDYSRWVAQGTPVLTGSRYAVLRPQFALMREAALARRAQQEGRLEKILVTMGNTDEADATSLVLDVLQTIKKPIHIDVVMGAAATHLAKIRDRLPAMQNRAALHVAVADMAGLMTAADLCIGAGGTTSWERCCLGLPTIMIEIADNQKATAAALDAAHAVRNLGPLSAQTGTALRDALTSVLEDKEFLPVMSRKAAAICDGRGVERLLPFLYPSLTTEKGGSVRLRTMEAGDEEMLFKWQSHPLTRRYARNSAVPSPKEHSAWMEKKLNDAGCKPFIILYEGKAAGMLRLDRTGAENSCEVSILVDPGLHGHGIAGAALAFIRDMEPAAVLHAEILPGNEASEKLFGKAGYVRREGNWYLNEK